MVGLVSENFKNTKASLALQNGRNVAVGHSEGLDHVHEGSNLVEVLCCGRFGVSIALRNHPKKLGALLCLLQKKDGLVASGRDGTNHSGELNRVAKRQQRKF